MGKEGTIYIVVLVVMIVGATGFFAYRDARNTNLCKQKYGNTAAWEGRNTCSMTAGDLK